MEKIINKKENPEPQESQNTDTKGPLHPAKGMEILNMLKRGTEFTQDLLKENEKLRYIAAKFKEQNEALKLHASDGVSRAELDLLNKKLKSLEDENSRLVERFKEVEKENVDFANKYVEVEQENNMLANLYISSYQLHSSLDFNEVIRVIMEIIINLIGAEQFSLLLIDEKSHELKAVASEGIEQEEVPTVKVGEGVVGQAVRSGENYYRKDMSANGSVNPLDPLVCIPMKIKERVIGAIAVYKLFQQKECFTNLDYELFSMLAGHAATAVFSSKLYTESERRLSTIQGFIDLITK